MDCSGVSLPFGNHQHPGCQYHENSADNHRQSGSAGFHRISRNVRFTAGALFQGIQRHPCKGQIYEVGDLGFLRIGQRRISFLCGHDFGFIRQRDRRRDSTNQIHNSLGGLLIRFTGLCLQIRNGLFGRLQSGQISGIQQLLLGGVKRVVEGAGSHNFGLVGQRNVGDVRHLLQGLLRLGDLLQSRGGQAVQADVFAAVQHGHCS